MNVNNLTYDIRKAAFAVHSELGPGLLESAYESCLAFELRSQGYEVQRQLELPLIYRNHQIGKGYRIDMVVEQAVLLELKSVSDIHPLHEAQLLSYLRLSGLKVGMLMNFNVLRMRDGIHRFVQDL